MLSPPIGVEFFQKSAMLRKNFAYNAMHYMIDSTRKKVEDQRLKVEQKKEEEDRIET